MEKPVVTRLEWTEVPGRPELFPLAKARILIGRRSDADVVISNRLTSRQHAHIILDGDEWIIEDLQSTHGTFVNGDRISRHALQHHDKIRLGSEGIELHFFSGGHDTQTGSLLESVDLDLSVRRLASVLPQDMGDHSELEKISCLLDFHYSFGKAFSPEKTFHHILKSALRISGAERAFVLRKESGDFVYALGLDQSDRTLGEADFRTSRTVVDQVTRTGQPVFMTQGISGDLAGQQSIVAMNLRAVACLPLEGMSQEGESASVMGIVYLDSRSYMHSLSGLDEQLLTRLAAEAGHVLEKLELVETLAEQQRLEKELAVAEETQRTLLPLKIPPFEPFHIIAFCRATRQLGGDFYDFIPCLNGELAGVLADVSGKGIPAALLSSLTLGALNMEFRTSSEPGRVLNELNKLLCQKTPVNRFVTGFLFQLNAEGKGRYISAGHNTCWVYRAAARELEDLPSCGMPLGMFALAAYEPVPLELAPGDLMVIYSDGLTDAENSAGEEFGEDIIRDLIKSAAPEGAKALETKLLAALDKFTQGAPQTDDITFLLVENHPR